MNSNCKFCITHEYGVARCDMCLAKHITLGDQLSKACRAWIDKYQPTCVESIYQADRCVINAPEMVEAVCAILGYYEDDE